MAGGSVETHLPTGNAERKTAAIAKLRTSTDDRNHIDIGQVRCARQVITQILFFGPQLHIVVHVLPRTAPAARQIRAWCKPAASRGIEDPQCLGVCVRSVILADLHLYIFSGHYVAHEDDLAVDAANSVRPVRKTRNVNRL